MAKVKGIEALLKQFKTLRKIGNKALEKGLDRVGTLIETDAKANVPKRRGALAASIKKENIELGVKVGTDEREAPYVEFGTRGGGLSIPPGQEDYAMTFIGEQPGHTPPQPYLFPALFKNQDKIVPFIEEELEKALKEVK